MQAAPVAIRTDGSVSTRALAWRRRGELRLTVVVKALFALGADGAHAGPGVVALEDRTFGGNPTRSVEMASDLVPHRARCDVTFVGFAHAPSGRPVPSMSVRLGVARAGHVLLDKVLHVFGDRRGGGAPEPFVKMPLVYERAFGGPGEPNPVGTDAPNVVDPTDARRAAGYAPISRFWPARKRLLGGVDRRALEIPILDVADALDWAYFQAAPPDQQIEPLRGGETIVLDGLHATQPRLQTTLPTRSAAARVVVPQRGAGEIERDLPLTCDTLAVDGEAQTIALVWRGHCELACAEAELASVVVLAGLAPSDRRVAWSDLRADVAPTRPTTAADDGDGDGTVTLAPDGAAALSVRPVTPFQGPPSSRSAAPSTDATPWSSRPVARPRAPAAGDATLAPAHAGAAPDETLFVDAAQAVASSRPVAPFAIAPPGATVARAPVPGAPWSGTAAASPPPVAETAGGETIALGAAPPRSWPEPAPPAPPPSFRAPLSLPHDGARPVPPSQRDPAPTFAAAKAAPAQRPAAAAERAPRPARPVVPSAPSPPAPRSFDERLRAAGATSDDLAALMHALKPPPPPPPDDEG